jgi:thioredoxin-like negative regulator of GroEL
MHLNEAREKFLESQRLFAGRRFSEALAILRELDQAYPASKNILLAQAQCLAHLFQSVEAVKICDRIIARYDCPPAHDLKMHLVKNDGMPPTVNLDSGLDLQPMDLGIDSRPRSSSDAGRKRGRPRWVWIAAGLGVAAGVIAVAGLLLYRLGVI